MGRTTQCRARMSTKKIAVDRHGRGELIDCFRSHSMSKLYAVSSRLKEDDGVSLSELDFTPGEGSATWTNMLSNCGEVHAVQHQRRYGILALRRGSG